MSDETPGITPAASRQTSRATGTSALHAVDHPGAAAKLDALAAKDPK